ncbi:MAG: hypothetical protein AAB092_07030 [Chloroflexota bacterium]
MRTLIVGLSLPNADFDNHSFLNAPSFAEYQQLVVDTASVSRTVDDVVNGAAAHTTYGGQAIVNGDASAHAFSLRTLLEMRRRETEWVISHVGLVVLLAYPEVTQSDVAGGPWRSYDWLPRPEAFSFETDLLAGFGRPGAVLVDSGHAFAPYIQQLAPHVAYRVYLNETVVAVRNAHVFARSSGGQAIGFELPLGEGRLVVLPPLVKPESDRPRTAAAIADSLAHWREQASTAAERHTKKEVS